jgi:glyoxylase-like metal-dependent hydrolase (beta-lactamase superfamily II)
MQIAKHPRGNARSDGAWLFALAAVFIFAGAGLVQKGAAQQTPAPAGAPAALFTLKPLGHNVFAAIPNPGSGAGGNSAFIIGDDGVAIVDTFQTVAAARQLLETIHKQTQLPVKFVVNTHYHLDHVAGNRVFAEAGAVIFAQTNVRDWIHSENPKFFGAAITPEQKVMVAELMAPEVVYDRGVDLYLGSRHIEVRVFPGHTGGDSVVLVPDAEVVFTGDLFWNHMLPNLIDASTEPMMATLASLANANAPDAFVPGHGEVGTARDITEFRGYIANLRELVGRARVQGKSGDALADAVLPQLKEKYGQWGIFDHFAKRNILDTAAELYGTKKIPKPAATAQ